MAYYDFNTAPTKDTNLKADWGIQKVLVCVFDDTGYLVSRYRSGVQTTASTGFSRSIPYTVGGWSEHPGSPEWLWYSASQIGISLTSTGVGSWAQANIMTGTFSLADDYGMKVGDKISIGTGENTSHYLMGVPFTSDSGSIPFIQLRSQGVASAYVSTDTSGVWKEHMIELTASHLVSRYWDMFISRYIQAGTFTLDTSQRGWRIWSNRRRDIYVDYGSTIGDLLSSSNLPTTWKKPTGTVANPMNWIVNNGTYAGKKLSEIPTSTQITSYWDIRVRY